MQARYYSLNSYLKRNYTLYISVLGLDEAWYKVYEVLQQDVPKNQRKPIKEFYTAIKKILKAIEGLTENIKIVQFENNFSSGVRNSVENIGKYNSHPRDAFHLAYMQDLSLNAIVTKDKNQFSKVAYLRVISY